VMEHEHIDMATAEFCRHPGCGRRWTTDIEMADGSCTFMCDEHWNLYAVDDPVHGRVVRVSGTSFSGPDEDEPGAPGEGEGGHRARRKTRRKAERKARSRSR
jgi:hypothetical protein